MKVCGLRMIMMAMRTISIQGRLGKPSRLQSMMVPREDGTTFRHGLSSKGMYHHNARIVVVRSSDEGNSMHRKDGMDKDASSGSGFHDSTATNTTSSGSGFHDSTATNTTTSSSTMTNGFKDTGLRQELLDALVEMNLVEPTEIQQAVIPKLLLDRKSDFSIASHTGSGKTLAYLLPVMHMLKESEEVFGIPMKPRRPRALVLGPTRELIEQIYSVAKELSRMSKLRTVVLTGGKDMSSQKMALGRGLDVLIATPTRVVQHAEKGNLFYGDIETVIIDEADTMMDRGFGVDVKKILAAVRSKPMPARCILVSATMTKQVKQLTKEIFPKMREVETSTLHKGVSGSKHAFLPVQGDKLELVLQLVEADLGKQEKTIVFCNTLDSCRAVEHYCSEQGFPTVCYHGDVPLEERKIAIATFVGGGQEGEQPILVATDLAARGLDIPGKIDHVINFDFPLNPVDYLHRSGRTARAGAKGKITSIVAKGDQVLARRIEEALAKSLPLDSLSANKKVLPPHMRPKPETLERRRLERKYGKKDSNSSRTQGQHSSKGTRRRSSGSTKKR